MYVLQFPTTTTIYFKQVNFQQIHLMPNALIIFSFVVISVKLI